MKLTTIATEHGTSAARISDGTVVALPYPHVVALLGDAAWRSAAYSTGVEYGDAGAPGRISRTSRTARPSR